MGHFHPPSAKVPGVCNEKIGTLLKAITPQEPSPWDDSINIKDFRKNKCTKIVGDKGANQII